jgi:hypothetical protein
MRPRTTSARARGARETNPPAFTTIMHRAFANLLQIFFSEIGAFIIHSEN